MCWRCGPAWKPCGRCSRSSSRYLGLAIIVLFQSEIRRTLARLGRKRWLGWRGITARRNRSNEILMAVEQLAAQKIGALIVLERDIGLRTFIESGVRWSAHLARSAALHLPARPAAARWRGDRAERPHRGGGLLPAADHQPRAYRASWARAIAPPSASPRRPIASRWWSPRRPAASRWPLSANWCRGSDAGRSAWSASTGISACERPTPIQIDEFAADIPLASESAALPALDGRPSEKAAQKVNQP